MYESKRAIQSLGGSAVCFYTPELDERSDALSTLSHDLREALERKEIYAALEPIVDIRSNALVGYEVMARWQHPQKGEIPARQFIGVAEAEGFAHAISEYVFDLACRRWSDMETVFGRELILSFNISAAEFAVDDLAERMSRRARVYGIAPEKVQIEIPESCLSDDPWKSGERVAELREAGLGVVLAGFGQSPTSYEHLMGLNFSALQIPAGFVRGTPDDRRRSGVVQSMIVLARSMDLQVIAQGVECAQQHMWLADLGDVLAQGSFYFPEHAVKLMPDGRDTADDLVERPG
jgi:EAL domain-containing protein (putative c-di-GMP-specific phosphodiesterase class I)